KSTCGIRGQSAAAQGCYPGVTSRWRERDDAGAFAALDDRHRRGIGRQQEGGGAARADVNGNDLPLLSLCRAVLCLLDCETIRIQVQHKPAQVVDDIEVSVSGRNDVPLL